MAYSSKFFELYTKHFNWLHLLVITILLMAIFWPVHNFSFVIGWDDQTFVTNHYTEDGLARKNLNAIITEFYHGQYAPVNQLYYSLIFEIFDYNPIYYHIGGFVIHLINAALVYKFVGKISMALFSYTAIKNAQVAFFTTIFFACAPVNLEPVAWVSASKVLLYAMFYLMSLISYIKYINTKKNIYFYLVIIGFIISFGAKEQAVTMPVCMLLIDFAYKRDFKEGIVWYEKLPFVVLSLLFALASLQSQGMVVFGGGKFYPITDRMFLFFYTISEYFTKIFIPVNLSYVYPYPFQIGEKSPMWLWVYPFFIPVALFCLKRFLLRKWMFFGALFFLIHILVVSNLFSLARYSAIADRYAYLSSIGIYFILASIIVKANSILSFRSYVLGMSVIYTCFFAFYTHNHSFVWENSITLKRKIKTVMEHRSDYKKP
ncbi:hypothetical protein SAMN05421821_11481 [Mucilaginibacter lappiensis]|uniref:Dolichyl-phosphate-mannose-protein mannosyltransferase n=2 Tax=Mucilaginibacter lappiensis TaxID=354630 RepID=A0ABR6PPV3_9SPHI|nr:hypothetical protein [Mucilaginibacter lappiensis]MBB6111800.1 hypothetical protein [Mucilaginibacter lappiensis]SIR87765.1 hypothetical protein SAMN05421821_11481 [Mucilaginibacter lappiensis]